jgi:hypothetical protein
VPTITRARAPIFSHPLRVRARQAAKEYIVEANKQHATEARLASPASRRPRRVAATARERRRIDPSLPLIRNARRTRGCGSRSSG